MSTSLEPLEFDTVEDTVNIPDVQVNISWTLEEIEPEFKYCPICDKETLEPIEDEYWTHECKLCGVRAKIRQYFILWDRALPVKAIENLYWKTRGRKLEWIEDESNG